MILHYQYSIATAFILQHFYGEYCTTITSELHAFESTLRPLAEKGIDQVW